MVYAIYVSGTRFSGKTALSLGLFGKFQEMGFNVGYFKPVGQGQKMIEGKLYDPDVILMKEVMGLQDRLDDLCPIVLGKRYLDQITEDCSELAEKALKAYDRVQEDKDVMLIESAARPEFLACCDLDLARFAKEFDAKVVFSVKGDDDTAAERAILYRDYMKWKGVNMLGTVLNFVPFQQLERMRGVVSPILERCGIEVLGVVPDHRELTLPTVNDVTDVLDAEVLTGRNHLENIVDNYLVGAMSPESAIVLTGNIYPSVRVLSTAEAKGIPILLVQHDTYTTVTKLEVLNGRIAPSTKSARKIQLTQQIVGEYVNWKKILDEYVDWKHSEKNHLNSGSS
jgi:BioD-like phosphotransacetylase family protein